MTTQYCHFQYSCLEKSMDRGAWQATVHGVAESWTRLSTWNRYVTCGLSLPYLNTVKCDPSQNMRNWKISESEKTRWRMTKRHSYHALSFPGLPKLWLLERKNKTISLIFLSGQGVIPSFQRCLLHPRQRGHHDEKADTLPVLQGLTVQ